MEKQNTSWINEDGNLCFPWKEDSAKGLMLIMTIIIAILIISTAIDVFFEKEFSIVALASVLVIFGFTYYLTIYNEKKKDDLMLSEIKTKFEELIASYISKLDDNIQEKKRCIYYQTKGTYGILKGTYILSLLSDGSVIEYELRRHSFNGCSYYELINDPKICVEEERLKPQIRN